MTDEYEDDLPPLADVDIGDRYRTAAGDEIEITCVLYGFDRVKAIDSDGNELSISFEHWLANPPTLLAKVELEDGAVYGAPADEAQELIDLADTLEDDDWSDEDDPEDEELMLQQVKNMAAQVKETAYDRYRDMGYDYETAQAMAYKDRDALVNNYLIQRMARR